MGPGHRPSPGEHHAIPFLPATRLRVGASGPCGNFGDSLSGHGGPAQGAPSERSASYVSEVQRGDGPPCPLPAGGAVRSRRGVARHLCSVATRAPRALRRKRTAPQRMTEIPAWSTSDIIVGPRAPQARFVRFSTGCRGVTSCETSEPDRNCHCPEDPLCDLITDWNYRGGYNSSHYWFRRAVNGHECVGGKIRWSIDV